jgi:hypothetical protein
MIKLFADSINFHINFLPFPNFTHISFVVVFDQEARILYTIIWKCTIDFSNNIMLAIHLKNLPAAYTDITAGKI